MVENRGPELQAVVSTFVACAFVATVLRVYVRTCIVKAFGYDDAWMVFALLAYIWFSTCSIAGVHYGTGRHEASLSKEDILKATRFWWLCFISYCWAMIAAKISIGLFLLRVTVKAVHKWIIYIAMGLTGLTGLVFFFVTLLQCSPISFYWNKNLENGRCVEVDVIIGLTFLYSAISIVCDFIFAILPMFLVWGLNMSVRTRLVLIPILGMACIASVAIVVRLGYVMDFKDPDFLWATVDIAIWSDVEQGLAITAGSLATLRPLYRLLASRLGFTSTGTPSGPSNPAGARASQWKGVPGSEGRKTPGIFSSLMRMEKVTLRQRSEDFGMGNLQPIRLRDDAVEGDSSEKSDRGYNTWRIQAGKVSDEECRVGTITRETHVLQQSERR